MTVLVLLPENAPSSMRCTALPCRLRVARAGRLLKARVLTPVTRFQERSSVFTPAGHSSDTVAGSSSPDTLLRARERWVR